MEPVTMPPVTTRRLTIDRESFLISGTIGFSRLSAEWWMSSSGC